MNLLDTRAFTGLKNAECIVVKTTNKCNLSCDYCYEDITNDKNMDLHVFKNLIDELVSQSTAEKITILLHGGEPLIMPEQWLIEAVDYARNKGKDASKQITISMQSNLHHITDRKIALIKKLDIRLGVSIDAPDTFAAHMRGSSKRVIANFLRLRKSQVMAGVITTINESNYTKFSEICNWFENELDIKDFKANVVYPVGAGAFLPALSSQAIFEAQKGIIDYMLETSGKGLIEYNLAYEIARFFSDRIQTPKLWDTLCQEQSCQAGNKVIGVTVDGNILPCGRFGDHRNEIDRNKGTHSITVDQLLFATKENWLDCHSCKAKSICSFGCLAFIIRSKKRINLECQPTKMRFDYYEQNKNNLIQVYHHIMERGLFKASYPDGRYSDTCYTDGSYTDYYSDGYTDKGGC